MQCTRYRLRTLSALFLVGAFAAAPAQEEHKQFDVVSIRENRAGGPSSSNFPLDPTVRYNCHGDLLRARNIPLLQLLVFAYAKNMYDILEFRRQLPAWARDMRFDVEARTQGSPTKDEMRAMVRSMLDDRFQLKLHTETQTTDVLLLELVHPGRLGPKLRPYAATEPPCDPVPPYGDVAVAALTPDGFPAYCGVMVWMPGTPADEIRVGGRRLTAKDIALGVGAAADFTQRPVIDATGLAGAYDVLLTYAPVTSDPSRVETSSGIPLEIAPRKQLGLKLQPGKGSVETYLIDHVSKPTEN